MSNSHSAAHHHHRIAAAASPAEISGDRGSMIKSLRHLWPYIWPSDRVDLKMRVVYSFAILLVAKIITLIVPFTYKWAVDALTGHGSAPVAADNWLAWVIASPILLTVSYGVARVLMGVLQQWRDGVFAKVAMHAVRR